MKGARPSGKSSLWREHGETFPSSLLTHHWRLFPPNAILLPMRIEPLTDDHFDRWLPLRQALWPRESLDQLRDDARRTLADPNHVGFFAFLPEEKGRAIGFIEAALYRDGESGSPRVHLEAWYVEPDHRRRGVGQGLLGHVERWCLHRSIALLTSDTNAEYPVSPDAHAGAGFEKLAELQIFVKRLRD